MGNVVVGIHQPNFMPWLGYFLKISQSDKFIFLDDVQFPKTGGGGYPNRVAINIQGKSQWITAPIKRKSGVWNINETYFLDNRWKKKIIGSLQGNYAKAPFFKKHKDFIFELIEFETDNLAEYNMNSIQKISKALGLETNFVKSSQFNLKTTSTKRLVELITSVNGNTYLSGVGGDNYQDKELYQKENITLIYNKPPSIEYTQYKSDDFIKGLTVIDAIFNIGIERLSQIIKEQNEKK